MRKYLHLLRLGLLLAALPILPGRFAAAAPAQPLAGTWAFKLDPENAGLTKKWFEQTLSDTIPLPGSTDQAKKGPGNSAAPNYDYLYRPYPYCGAAWYQREIEIPEAWRGQRVTLVLERCHWETQVWLDGEFKGMRDSLCVAHEHELGINLQPGRHRLTLRVDNSHKFDMGPDAHSTSDQTQTNWNGVVGRIELRAGDPLWIDALKVTPDVARKTAAVEVTLGNATGKPAAGAITLHAVSGEAQSESKTVAFKIAGTTGTATAELALGEAMKLWDEFAPNLYTLTAALQAGGAKGVTTTTFGMRKLGVTPEKKQFTLNGRPIFLRGTLDCCIYPKTGYPPTDVASWLRVIKTCQSYGLNHIRFHSWCPPEAAFAAADQMGFLFQVELPCWIHNYTAPGTEARDRFLEGEMLRILTAYGNHPSFGLLCMGNEPGPRDRLDFIHHLVARAKALDPRRLYVSGSGWGFGPDDDYHVAAVRGVKGPDTDHDFRAQDAAHPVPVVSHEIGQWTVYPRLAEMAKYDGVTRARNFELVRDDLKAKGMLGQAADFTLASGRLAAQLYKEEIEVLLRTPGHGGFQLLDLHDFPGQGTALVGVLDPFWESKGLIAPEAWRRFCGPVVPLARFAKRTWTAGETFTAAAELAQFGPADLQAARPVWSLKDEAGRVVAAGKLAPRDLPTGRLLELGQIEAPLNQVKAPAKLTFTLALEGAQIANDWNLWVYPPKTELAPPAGVTVCTAWDDRARAALAAGGKVLLLAPGTMNSSLPGSFTPVFWSPVWFKRGAGTMSILCDPRHPALSGFPTAMQTDWQWQDLLQNSRTLILDGMPAELWPIVQVIDNFARNHRLGNLFEAKVGPGSLLVCSLDLAGRLGERPAARQMLRSLYDYLASENFHPAVAIEPGALERLFEGDFAGARADSEEAGYEALNACDGDPATLWHTAWTGRQAKKGFPHELVLELVKPARLAGVRLAPRQDGNRNGWIKDYALYISADGKHWGEPVARGALTPGAAARAVRFAAPAAGRFVKLVALSGFGRENYCSLAELEILK